MRAAIRALAAAVALRMISLPSCGFCSNQAPSRSFTTRWTKPLTSVLPSLVFVWPSNCGSASLTEMIAVRPSRMSSPVSLSSFFLIIPWSSPNELTSEVSAARKPSSWVPPSWVLIAFAKVCTDSWNEPLHCIATSRLSESSPVAASNAITSRCTVSRMPVRYFT